MTVYQWTNYDRYKSQHMQVREYYDTVHRCFDLALHRVLPQPCDLALDVACGHGESTKLLLEHASSIIGIDSSEELIDIARNRNTQPNVRYECTSFADFSDHRGAFGLITAVWFWNHLHHERDLIQAADRMASMLHPGGRVAFVIPGDAFTTPRTQAVAREHFQWRQAWTQETTSWTQGIFSYDGTWIETTIWQPLYLMRLLSRWFELECFDVKGTMIREQRMPGLVCEPPFEVIYGCLK